MSKGTYSPVDLTDPIVIFTNTATVKATYQVFVDVSTLQSGDTLNVKIKSNTASVSVNTLLNENIVLANLPSGENMVVSYPVLMDEDDTYSVTLEQTTGTLRTFKWAVNFLEF